MADALKQQEDVKKQKIIMNLIKINQVKMDFIFIVKVVDQKKELKILKKLKFKFKIFEMFMFEKPPTKKWSKT